MEKAFTLIELLVVVAVIAILAALILPSLTRAKTAAKSLNCRSNLRQIFVGLSVYTSGTGKYPLEFSWEDKTWWPATLESFVGARWHNAVYSCPGETNPNRARMDGQWSDIMGGTAPTGDYGYNAAGCSLVGRPLSPYAATHWGEFGLGGFVWGDYGPTRLPMRDSAVIMPSEMLAFGDAFEVCQGHVLYFGGPLEIDSIYRYADDWAGFAEREAAKCHESKANTVFCDGHAESLRFAKLFSRADEVLQRWNVDHLPHRDRLFQQ